MNIYDNLTTASHNKANHQLEKVINHWFFFSAFPACPVWLRVSPFVCWYPTLKIPLKVMVSFRWFFVKSPRKISRLSCPKAFGSAADTGRSHSGSDSLGTQRVQESDKGGEFFEAPDVSKLGRFRASESWGYPANHPSHWTILGTPPVDADLRVVEFGWRSLWKMWTWPYYVQCRCAFSRGWKMQEGSSFGTIIMIQC